MVSNSPATITVTGHGQVTVQPDKVEIRFQIEAVDPRYANASVQLNERVHALRASLAKQGVDPDQLRTGQLQIQPRYHHHQGKRMFSGFAASQRLAIRLPLEQDLLQRVLQELPQSAAEAELHVQFGVTDPVPHRHRALTLAVAAARAEADVLALSANCEVSSLQEIRPVHQPINRSGGVALRMAASEAAAPAVDPADLVISAEVNLTWQLRPITA